MAEKRDQKVEKALEILLKIDSATLPVPSAIPEKANSIYTRSEVRI